jgi:hypothetical protein
LDPEESYDIADEHPEVVADIRRRIERLIDGFPEEVRKDYYETLKKPVATSPAGQFPRAQQ